MKTSISKEPLKSVLAIVLGLLVLYAITKKEWLLTTSIGIGVLAVLSDFIAQKIDFAWMLLAQLLNKIIPPVLLTLIFYFVLFPVASLSRLLGKKDILRLKNNSDSLFIPKNQVFDRASFEKTW